jgi:protocatechuate 3,4-dioxygenase beta subunit
MKPIEQHEEHDDDRPIGRILSRREVLSLLGGAGAALVVGTGFTRLNLNQLAATATPEATPEATASLPACVVQPALTEGPYFVDEMLNRSDIRVEPSDGSIKAGVPLKLTFRVSHITGSACAPLAGAQVDVWHCDAQGVYSDVKDRTFDTSGKKFLRGYQVTDKDGNATFLTIYPGWYQGRTVHIHFKIRLGSASSQGYEFTSQLFFDDALSDQIFKQAVYAGKGTRGTRNNNDNIYQQGSSGQLTLQLVKDKEGDGYSAVFDIGLDVSEADLAAATAAASLSATATTTPAG